jgi:hypothetical protein
MDAYSGIDIFGRTSMMWMMHEAAESFPTFVHVASETRPICYEYKLFPTFLPARLHLTLKIR